ncbi:MAG TPA: hypothetical protein PK530_13070 [Anaerolineales bacterium]|nr:hypothetical protein [Anaerolineales bacterium]
MTPTLNGRWQTRLLMNLTIGVVFTALFGLAWQDFRTAFVALAYMTGLGLVWDVVYIRLQAWRWDHDWPPVLFLLGAMWEMLVLGVAIGMEKLPGLAPDYGVFSLLLHYGTVGLVSFLWMFGPMRVLFPRWRFRGGQWL